MYLLLNDFVFRRYVSYGSIFFFRAIRSKKIRLVGCLRYLHIYVETETASNISVQAEGMLVMHLNLNT